MMAWMKMGCMEGDQITAKQQELLQARPGLYSRLLHPRPARRTSAVGMREKWKPRSIPGTMMRGHQRMAVSGQSVISTGPYSIVRHPMYSGGVLMILATPLALGSLWAFTCAVLLCGVIAARMLSLEEVASVKPDCRIRDG
jgi:Phospholipid methyltransferase